MVNEVSKTIITSLVGIVALVLFSTSQGLLITPNFNSNIEYNYAENVQHESLMIKNVGLVQAKNVDAYVVSEDPLHIVKSSTACPEGMYSLPFPSTNVTIAFEKLSTNVDCLLYFESSKEGSISYIVITGDNAPGYQWKLEVGELKEFGINELIQIILTILSGVVAAATSYATHRKMKQQRIFDRLLLIGHKKNTRRVAIKKKKNSDKKPNKRGAMPKDWTPQN